MNNVLTDILWDKNQGDRVCPFYSSLLKTGCKTIWSRNLFFGIWARENRLMFTFSALSVFNFNFVEISFYRNYYVLYKISIVFSKIGSWHYAQTPVKFPFVRRVIKITRSSLCANGNTSRVLQFQKLDPTPKSSFIFQYQTQ